jgi:hypothetical protein
VDGDELLRRLALTPAALAEAVRGRDASTLARRPDATAWCALEVLCHLRDVEELFLVRFMTMLAMDEPKILAFGAAPRDLAPWGIDGAIGHPLDPDRWAVERQYRRNDPGEALDAFDRRRQEVLALLRGLSTSQWRRGGVHPSRGRLSVRDFAAALADHDDNHARQLDRALDGRAS